MRVAIIQDNIGPGGRIVVIISMIEIMNELNIIPDIFTFSFKLSKEDIEKKYGKTIQFNLKRIPLNIFKKFPEINKIFINSLMTFYYNKYDLFIDSNNTTCLMSKKIKKILSYTYFPRKRRIKNKEAIREFSNKSLLSKIAIKFDYFIAGLFYAKDCIKNNTEIITLSEFSRKEIGNIYNIDQMKIKIVYPPVDISAFSPNKKKTKSVSTIGRFAPQKKQLEQIKIAKELPELEFNIMGFAEEDDPYFLTCKKYIEKNKISNVILHRSIDYKKMINILERSKYFLHTLYNEPFGITTVQGIAAGCIPIVPNSGGQIEIVPIDSLRFDDISEVVTIIRDVEEKDFNEELAILYNNIERFSENSFKKSFKLLFLKIIGEFTNRKFS